MLKNMLFALHYAKLRETLPNYALHQKYISLNTAGQNKCLFCRKPYLAYSRHSNIVVVLVQGNVDNSITEGEEKRKIVASSCTGPC